MHGARFRTCLCEVIAKRLLPTLRVRTSRSPDALGATLAARPHPLHQVVPAKTEQVMPPQTPPTRQAALLLTEEREHGPRAAGAGRRPCAVLQGNTVCSTTRKDTSSSLATKVDLRAAREEQVLGHHEDPAERVAVALRV